MSDSLRNVGKAGFWSLGPSTERKSLGAGEWVRAFAWGDTEKSSLPPLGSSRVLSRAAGRVLASSLRDLAYPILFLVFHSLACSTHLLASTRRHHKLPYPRPFLSHSPGAAAGSLCSLAQALTSCGFSSPGVTRPSHIVLAPWGPTCQ